MKRLAIEEVRDAYRQTKLQPCRWLFLEKDSACAIGAVAIASGVQRVRSDVERWAIATFDKDYLQGFEMGFDGVKPEDPLKWESEYFTLGHQDGLVIAEAVFKTI